MRHIAVLILVLVFIVGCQLSSTATINGKKISVEVADEPAERETGLMYRKSLPEDAGMLFIFEDEAEYAFWMKNTLIPLDMVFIAADSSIVDIIEAEPCKSDPCAAYKPSGKAKYVLEVNKGYSLNNGIKKGDKVYIALRK